MTSTSLMIAAILTVFIGFAHSWLGERRLIGPLLAPEKRQGMLEKSGFARNVLRFAWHITTLAWWGFAAVLAALALSPLNGQARVVLLITGGMFFLTGIIILIMSRGRHLAWPVFLTIAALSVFPAMQ